MPVAPFIASAGELAEARGRCLRAGDAAQHSWWRLGGAQCRAADRPDHHHRCLSATILPEFVTGIVLILIFGVWLRWLPISASWPDGSGP